MLDLAMNKLFFRYPVLGKILVTGLILFIILAGRYLPVPLVNLSGYLPQTALEELPWHQIPQSSLPMLSIFSLGLGPWMYATILISLFSIGSKQSSLSPRMMEFRKNALMLLLAFIQGLGLAIGLNYGEGGKLAIIDEIFFVTLVTIAGAFVISWLASMNAAYGLGGTAIIILINIIVGQFYIFPLFLDLFQTELAFVGGLILAWTALSVYLTVVLDQAEYRVPIQRIAIKNDLMKEAYMPIKLNISGGMPFMYAYTLLAFPQYIFLLLSFLFPNQAMIFQYLASYFTLTNLEGILFFLAILALLTISFAFTTVNPTEKTREMRRTGDYIPLLRPGQPTKAYLISLIFKIGTINAVFLLFMVGLPLLLSLDYPDIQRIAGLPGIFMMVVGILLTIIKEVKMMGLKKRYGSLFELK
ncbi:accessory Sec system protein translocase subunit SecY2 [Streptococcus suis]|nr:accessory Sec system protein translocase subunit SecY2 [Streptococcus suis]